MHVRNYVSLINERKKERAHRLFRRNDTQRTNKLLGSSHFREPILRSVGKGSHVVHACIACILCACALEHVALHPECKVMGKPKATKNAKSNPFAVKKSIKKAKKKIKPSLELIDKTFGDLQDHRKMLTSSSASKKSNEKTLSVAQEIIDMNKSERTAKTANFANVDQLVNDTAQAKI